MFKRVENYKNYLSEYLNLFYVNIHQCKFFCDVDQIVLIQLLTSYLNVLIYLCTISEKYLTMSLDEKRKNYKCGNNYVTLDQVSRWPEYASAKINQS